jgi:predicted dehydrogenase
MTGATRSPRAPRRAREGPPPRAGGAPRLRYAVIGAGSVARTHLRDAGGQPGVSIVGVADPADPRRWRADPGSAARFSDPARMLAATRPQLVSICTPTRFHRELTLLALRAGAHVICEKPMAMTVQEAREMEHARAAAGRLGAINFPYRNSAPFRFAREVVAAGELGRLTRVACSYLQSFLGAADSGWTWRSDVDTAGFGALGDLGVHMVDAVRFVTGLEFERVVGLTQTLITEKPDGGGATRPVTTETNAAFLAELADGVACTFETSQVASGYGDSFRLEVGGDLGTLIADSERPGEVRMRAGAALNRHATFTTDIPVHRLPTELARSGPPPPAAAAVEALRGARVPYPRFADGLAAQRVLGALVESTRTGGWVHVG